MTESQSTRELELILMGATLAGKPAPEAVSDSGLRQVFAAIKDKNKAFVQSYFSEIHNCLMGDAKTMLSAISAELDRRRKQNAACQQHKMFRYYQTAPIGRYRRACMDRLENEIRDSLKVADVS
jgi:hypothetical protein